MSCDVRWRFAPQVTVIGGQPTPSTVAPIYIDHSDVELTYPYVSPTLTITLRSPKLGDVRNITVEAARNVSMGGYLTIGRNTIWPIVQIFTYDFEALDEDLIEDYFDFIRASVGQEIGLRDHRGLTWRGFILNPDGASTNHQVCDSSLSINFRGTQVI